MNDMVTGPIESFCARAGFVQWLDVAVLTEISYLLIYLVEDMTIGRDGLFAVFVLHVQITSLGLHTEVFDRCTLY